MLQFQGKGIFSPMKKSSRFSPGLDSFVCIHFSLTKNNWPLPLPLLVDAISDKQWAVTLMAVRPQLQLLQEVKYPSWVWVFFILNIIAAIYSKTSRTNILNFYASDAGIRNITKCFDLWPVEQKMHPPLSDTSILSCEKPLYCYLM